MALDFREDARLQTPLRVFHESMVGQLKATFGERVVEPHAVEVDPETIRQYCKGPLALWSVVAACQGMDSSDNTELRMEVRWAIFVVAQSWRSAGSKSPTAKKDNAPTYVAEAAANWACRLAYRSRWGIQNGVSEVKATDIKIHNLGVGLKSNSKFAQAEHLGLYVVWGSQEIDMGASIAPGDEQFPGAELIASTIEDQLNLDKPSVKDTQVLTFAVAKLVGWLGSLWSWARRRVFGVDVAGLVAARIKRFVRQELVVDG